ncbi:hypothetical protein DET49_1201 [Salegentibacter sp. 24]|uniref:hypothetical protein n=1 Tax=Salegentibacter sp. 24 TaxID=2183986 RepID=UPI00105EB04F|nr:hypothetical protein [Salegentibacter sp. 24]TDN83802.1 hypothetical protein DET49_1201 [Salegentibacter sp. 24]
METKNLNPKATLLIGAGLDVLHFESMEWLAKIDFWKDEVQFFENLLRKNTSSDIGKQSYNGLLVNLDKIHGDLFEDLEDSIREHEGLLSNLQKEVKGLSDSDYRKKHHKLKMRMDDFENDFKTFKKIIFEHVKGFII